jgi:4-alpha-glucanotransferase
MDASAPCVNAVGHAVASLSVSSAPVLIRFAVTARTKYGESIVLSGSAAALGGFTLASAVHMSYEKPGVWFAEVALPRTDAAVRYKFAVRSESGTVTYEPGAARALQTNVAALEGDFLVRDTLRAEPDASREIFGTAAFADIIFRRPREARKPAKVAAAEASAQVSKAVILGKGAYVARFSVFCERVRQEDEVVLLGVGGAGPIPMNDVDAPEWTVAVAMPPTAHRLEYRFAVRNKATGEMCVTEAASRVIEFNHDDRLYLGRNFGAAAIVILTSERALTYPTRWRGSGIAIPVFSLRSKASCGVGEFNDLLPMVDLCAAAGYQMLQLLPINDTTSFNSWRDSYPYSAVSSFALHPQYLNIDALGTMPASVRKAYAAERDELNALPEIDYERMMAVKGRFVRDMYSLHKVELFKSRAFEEWFGANQAWLVPYALFRFLMEVNGTSNYDSWGARKSMTLAEMEQLSSPGSFHFDYVGLAYYTQYHLHKQLTAASEYAAKSEVVLKGDLPIGVNRYCVDTWVNPHLFRLHMQAGAPPDFFAKAGQNWFFPTYDWEAMSKDGYGWWRARLGHMAKYFDAYRIDHILGFFRIWEIPERYRTGMGGRMYPAHPISRSELESRGLWDVQRLTMPYVRDGLLQGLFHDDWWKVKERFFAPLWEGRLKFKDEYDSERKCERALKPAAGASPAQVAQNEALLQGLFALHNNVCLLPDEAHPDAFHPRFMMHDTSSYRELGSGQWKTALHDLYEDYFFHRQEELWRGSGLEKLPMMKSASNMLVCGEDLGFVPTSVPAVMKETCIISLKVQRMPDKSEDVYGVPSKYPYECVATTSSHDTSTFRGWWEEMPADHRQKYWSQLMGRGGSAPASCSPDIAEWAVADHLSSPAMWTVFPLQDLLAMDESLRRRDAAEEQINNPADSMHYWRFRLHIPVEDVMASKSFVQKLKTLNGDAGRGQAY